MVYHIGLYPYCDDCLMPHQNLQEKLLCGLHWRPLSGTKAGFPLENGWNCPKDTVNERMIEAYAKAKINGTNQGDRESQ